MGTEANKIGRYIYNRVVLENAIVRAAAVSSLAKFGVNAVDAAMRRSVGVLLSRCAPILGIFKLRLLMRVPDAWTMWMTKYEIGLRCTSR